MRDESGLIVDYAIEGEYPTFGNDDDRADDIAVDLVGRFMDKIRKQPTYRDATHTQSVLTITSNVVYGKTTGNTPDGRRTGEPFAPGANPMNGRDNHGVLASALSVAKLPYDDAQDGISLTTTVMPSGLGRERGGAGHQPGGHPRRLQRVATASTSTSTCSTARRSKTRWSTRRTTRSSPSGSPAMQ